MMTWLNSIIDGFQIFGALAFPVFVPAAVLPMILSRKYNVFQLLLKELFLLYLCCVAALTFLPLPTLESAVELTYQAQLIPFYFVVCVAKNFCLTEILHVVLNVVMTIPFGMFLSYCYKMNVKKVVLFSFGLSLLIEVGQLTGLFFLFQGSYRLFDVDDLLCNTLGGLIGYLMICKAGRFLPAISNFDRELVFKKRPVLNA